MSISTFFVSRQELHAFLHALCWDMMDLRTGFYLSPAAFFIGFGSRYACQPWWEQAGHLPKTNTWLWLFSYIYFSDWIFVKRKRRTVFWARNLLFFWGFKCKISYTRPRSEGIKWANRGRHWSPGHRRTTLLVKKAAWVGFTIFSSLYQADQIS